MDQAFSNCALALTHAGGKGWSEVYKIRMYVVKRNEGIRRGVDADVEEVVSESLSVDNSDRGGWAGVGGHEGGG